MKQIKRILLVLPLLDRTPVAAPHSALTWYFNSRHVVCLRVLVNTAISLKSTLQDSWNIIWIALQWCGYYLDGPDQFSPYFNNTKVQQTLKESKKPQISAQDDKCGKLHKEII